MGPSKRNNPGVAQQIFNALQDFSSFSQPRKIIIAHSGGIDSQALLHCLADNQGRLKNAALLAVHVHHGFHEEADKWQQHCQKTCHDLSIPFEKLLINVSQKKGQSLEAEARYARYEALATLVGEGDVLLTAQHQDDQAETLLLQLIRGAGINGLSAMPKCRRFSDGWHCRPMLDITRKEIEAYAKEHSLKWIEDSSNADTLYARNYLRHEVMPVLKKRWPSVTKTLSRSAQHCASAVELIEQCVQSQFSRSYDANTASLSINELGGCSRQESEAVLRLFIKTARFPLPSTKKMQDIQLQMLASRNDACPVVHWGGCCELRRYQQRIFIMPVLSKHDAAQQYAWTLQQSIINLGALGTLQIKTRTGAGVAPEKLRDRRLSVRFRQGGERIKLPGRSGTQLLKKLFQEKNVPPWLRARVPLVYADETLVMVIGMGIAEEYYTPEGQCMSLEAAQGFQRGLDNI